MTTILNRGQLEALARIEAFPCVTMQFPVGGGGRANRQDPVRLRNALRVARERLAEAGLAPAAAEELLAAAAALAEAPEFWAAPAGGVALFAAPGFFRAVRVDQELPERVDVGREFAIRGLLPLLGRVPLVYALALSRNRVRLVEATPAGARALDVPGLPESFAAAVGDLQYYSAVTARSSSPAALGRRSAIFHGHGDADEERDEANLESFCRRVVEALEQGLPEPEAPLALAAVAGNVPVFRRANRRLRLLDAPISGNPDLLSDAELGAAARDLAEDAARGEVDRELLRWVELHAAGRALAEVEPIVRAAEEGRVEALFLAAEAERWGSYEPDLRRVTLHEAREAGDEELLERAASRTLAQSGDVHVLPLGAMPEGRVAVAILRFPETA
jgi:hypothetical protein